MKYLNKITNIYVYIILFLFPLIIFNGYTDILNIKWHFYVYISSIYMIVIISILLVLILKHKINIKDFNFKIYHILALIYLLVLIISTVFSPYKRYNLLMGSPRMEGLIVNIIYVLSFIFVSLNFKYDKKILDVFILPSILIGLIIILQYLGFNPFYLYKYGYSNIFYGTIGNIDIVGMLYIMYIVFIIFKYIFSSINKLLYFISFIISIIVMYIINVDATYFTLFVILLFLLPIMLLTSKYLKKYLNIIIWVIVFSFIRFNIKYIIILLLIFIFIRLIISKIEYNYLRKRNIIIGYILLLLILIVGLVIIYFNKFNIEMLKEINNIMHFKLYDEMGSYRIFLWKRTIMMLNKNILLGTGCDSFYIRFMNLYINDLKSIKSVTINDSACNIYLTMIINNGLLGLISFMCFIYSVLVKIKTKFNGAILTLFMTIFSYLFYCLFSFNVVIVTPIFYILLSVYTSYVKKLWIY